MHPIERLRYVARTGWAGPSMLAAEAALALGDLAYSEVPALVPACRRLLDRQPGCGPLWWVAARVLDAGDPVAEAHRCAQMLEDDPTPDLVLDAMSEGSRVVRRGGIAEVAAADLVIVEVDALGPSGMFVDSSAERLLASAIAVEAPVWVEAGVGRVLPSRIWDAMLRRTDMEETHAYRTATHGGATRARHRDPDRRIGAGGYGADIVTTAVRALVGHQCVEQVVGPLGAHALAEALTKTDCPEPPELLEDFPRTGSRATF